MPRYYIGVRDHGGVWPEALGVDLASLIDARRMAAAALYDLAGEKLRDELDFRLTATVQDEAGAVLHATELRRTSRDGPIAELS
jgi:hypothetical protein